MIKTLILVKKLDIEFFFMCHEGKKEKILGIIFGIF